MPRKKKKITLPPMVGDHGTGTLAATAGTVLEPLVDEATGKRDPNNRGRRRRVSQIDKLASQLSMRQIQAAQALRDAYGRVEALSSGSPLKERVQTSSRPDVSSAAQVDAVSHLKFMTDAIPGNPPQCRDVVEAVCFRNEAIHTIAKGRAVDWHRSCLKVALDLVANKLGY